MSESIKQQRRSRYIRYLNDILFFTVILGIIIFLIALVIGGSTLSNTVRHNHEMNELRDHCELGAYEVQLIDARGITETRSYATVDCSVFLENISDFKRGWWFWNPSPEGK